MEQQLEHTFSMNNRISKLETDVASIGTEVISIKEGQNAIIRKIDQISISQANSGKVSWPLIVGFSMLVIALCGGFSTATNLILNPMKQDIIKQEINLRKLNDLSLGNLNELSIQKEKLNYLNERLTNHISKHPDDMSMRIKILEHELLYKESDRR